MRFWWAGPVDDLTVFRCDIILWGRKNETNDFLCNLSDSGILCTSSEKILIFCTNL